MCMLRSIAQKDLYITNIFTKYCSYLCIIFNFKRFTQEFEFMMLEFERAVLIQ